MNIDVPMELIVPREKIKDALSLIQEYSDMRWASGNMPLDFIPDTPCTYYLLTVGKAMTYLCLGSGTSNYNELIKEKM